MSRSALEMSTIIIIKKERKKKVHTFEKAGWSGVQSQVVSSPPLTRADHRIRPHTDDDEDGDEVKKKKKRNVCPSARPPSVFISVSEGKEHNEASVRQQPIPMAALNWL